jgi:hypothetical protein
MEPNAPEALLRPKAAGREMDFVLEGASGQLVEIKVEASATLNWKVAFGLDDVVQATGKHFHRGIILHTGSEVIAFARNLYVLPVPKMWHLGSERTTE